MKKLLLTLFLIASIAYAQDTFIPLTSFSGGIDIVTPDKLNETNAPFGGIQDTRTDEKAQISLRKGIKKDNTTALTGSQKTRNGYTYNQIDGDSYKVWASSASVFASKGDTNYTTVITTLSLSYMPDFTTAQNNLWGSNGSEYPFSWNGTDLTVYGVTNSTNIVKARYIDWIWQRMWYAGVDGSRSRLYYSEAYLPAHIASDNYIDFAPDDGDVITGTLQSGDSIIVTKKNSTWEVIQTNAGKFLPKQIHPTIGCLYNTTLINFRGRPCFVSRRGVEHIIDTVNLFSFPVDNFFKNLRQLNIDQQIWTQTSAADWGAGSGTNIDTTTYSGSVSLNNDDYTLKAAPVCISTYTSSSTYYKARQSFIFTENTILSQCYYWVRFIDNPSNIIYNSDSIKLVHSSGTILTTLINPATGWVSVSDQVLSANNTYYLQATYNYGYHQVVVETTTATSDLVNTMQIYSNYTGTWETLTNYMSLGFKVKYTSASFTSQIKNADNWGSWGTFTVDETEPTGSEITYYVQCSTASDNLDDKSLVTVTNNGAINSTAGPYIRVVSSFTRTDASVIPKINEFNVSWYGTTDDIPCSVEYDDSLYVSVSTGTNWTRNDCIAVYQKDNSWTKYTGNVGAFTVFRNKLWEGSSLDTGQIYEAEVEDLYTDDGNSYTGTWTTKYWWVHPFYKTLFTDIWIIGDNTGATLNVDYRLDGSTGTWTAVSETLSSTSDTQVRKKIPLTHAQNAAAIQFRFRSTSDFKLNRLYILYNPIEQKE